MPTTKFDRKNFTQITPKLILICLFMSIGSIIFGYDTGMFGGVQAIPGYVRQFGECDIKGVCTLSASRVSLIQSIAFVGKFFGTLLAGPIIERYNHINAMYFMCFCCFIGTIIEATAKQYPQFIVGRIIMYFAVGITENAVPTYQSEIMPAAARGAVVASIQFFIGIGGFISAGINKSYSTTDNTESWVVPVCVQAIYPLVLCLGLWWIPLSPRWLISKGRTEEAARVLRSIRPTKDAHLCEQEVAAIQEALEMQTEKGPWKELFKGTNLRRTMIAGVVFWLAQFTGQAFMSQYGVRFYQTVGLGAMAFSYSLISSGVNLVVTLCAAIAVDLVGRRPLLVWGATLQAIFLYLIAGLGLLKSPNADTSHFFVACTILFNAFYVGSWGPIPYILGAEIGTGSLREKTMAFSSTVNVVSAFLVSFTLPYLLNAPYANLQSNVGWIFGSFAGIAAVFSYFCVPETKGRALEELDACFNEHISARRFSNFVSTGAAARVANLENSVEPNDGKAEIMEDRGKV